METQSGRRSFLKISLLAAAGLAAAGTAWYGLSPAKGPSKYRFDDSAKAVLAAIIPIFLQGTQTFAADALPRAITQLQNMVNTLSLQNQQDVAELFQLLAAAPARRWLVGVDDDWPQAKPEQVKAFVKAWRAHRSPTLQSAYLALHDLLLGSWYADESSWAGIGYPGPIKELS
jgi:hypothetical protein